MEYIVPSTSTPIMKIKGCVRMCLDGIRKTQNQTETAGVGILNRIVSATL